MVFVSISKCSVSLDFFKYQGYSLGDFHDFGLEIDFVQNAYMGLSSSICHVGTVKHHLNHVKNAGKTIQIGRVKIHSLLYFVLDLFVKYSFELLRKPHHLVQYDLLYLLMYINISRGRAYDEETQLNDPGN